MSQYSNASKVIGWNGTAVIPRVEEAVELVNRSKRGYITAFIQLFKIVRFAPSPTNKEEKKAMDIITLGFAEARKIFE